jgi:hypothetical protein
VLEVRLELQPVEILYARAVRLRRASALISAPSNNAIAVSHSHVSITMTAESEPHVLLYDPNVDV